MTESDTRTSRDLGDILARLAMLERRHVDPKDLELLKVYVDRLVETQLASHRETTNDRMNSAESAIRAIREQLRARRRNESGTNPLRNLSALLGARWLAIIILAAILVYEAATGSSGITELFGGLLAKLP